MNTFTRVAVASSIVCALSVSAYALSQSATSSHADEPAPVATEQSYAAPDANTVVPRDVPTASAPVETPLPACQSEDSDNCRWDASSRGNGRGNSFDSRNGVVAPVERDIPDITVAPCRWWAQSVPVLPAHIRTDVCLTDLGTLSWEDGSETAIDGVTVR